MQNRQLLSSPMAARIPSGATARVNLALQHNVEACLTQAYDKLDLNDREGAVKSFEEAFTLFLSQTRNIPERNLRFLEAIPFDDTDSNNNTFLHFAAKKCSDIFCHSLLNYFPIQYPNIPYFSRVNKQGETPIHCAARAGRSKWIYYFVYNYRIDAARKTSNGDNIIHLMIREKHVEAIDVFLESYPGFPLRDKNRAGYDPLMLAIFEGEEELALTLLKHHVDVTNKDHHGNTALDIAEHKGMRQVVQALITKGASWHRQLKIPANHAEVRRAEVLNVLRTTEIPIRNLVFEGGGVKGLGYIGALETALEQGLFRFTSIERVGGTSAGAIFALLVGLQYSIDEIAHISGMRPIKNSQLPQVNFKDLIDGDFGPQIFALKSKLFSDSFMKLENLKNVLNKESIARLMGLIDKGKDLAKKFESGWSIFINLIPIIKQGIALMKEIQFILNENGALIGKVKELISDLIPLFERLNEKLGLCPGNKVLTLIDFFIFYKTGIRNATFKELREGGYISNDLFFVGFRLDSDPDKQGRVVFSSDIDDRENQDMVVSHAVRISMSIPFLFVPHPKVTKNARGEFAESKEVYIDGGLILNYPIGLFDLPKYAEQPSKFRRINPETLGFRLISPALKAKYESKHKRREPVSAPQQSIQSLLDLVKGVFYGLYNKQEYDHGDSGDEFRTLYVETGDISPLDFDRVDDSSVKEFMYNKGRQGVFHFIQKTRKENYRTKYHIPKALMEVLVPHMEATYCAQDGIQARIKPNPELIVQVYARDNKEEIAFLHKQLNVSIWARDSLGNTALHIAYARGELAVVEALRVIMLNGLYEPNAAGMLPAPPAKASASEEEKADISSRMGISLLALGWLFSELLAPSSTPSASATSNLGYLPKHTSPISSASASVPSTVVLPREMRSSSMSAASSSNVLSSSTSAMFSPSISSLTSTSATFSTKAAPAIKTQKSPAVTASTYGMLASTRTTATVGGSSSAVSTQSVSTIHTAAVHNMVALIPKTISTSSMGSLSGSLTPPSIVEVEMPSSLLIAAGLTSKLKMENLAQNGVPALATQDSMHSPILAVDIEEMIYEV